MGLGGRQAWVTCVGNDNDIASALRLAASIRITGTNRKICLVISGSVSMENGDLLRKAFDYISPVDRSLVPAKVKHDLQGKIFALSLQQFEKCIYLTANTIVMENCDKLFEEEDVIYGALDTAWQIFQFVPNMALCAYLVQREMDCLDQSFDFGANIFAWLKNNAHNTISKQQDFHALQARCKSMQLSVESGRLLANGENHPMIIGLVDVPSCETELVGQMKFLLKSLEHKPIEKAIVSKWNFLNEKKLTGICMLSSCYKENFPTKAYANEPIAIVGMSCRFPGANNLTEFWNLLSSGQEGIRNPPEFRWKKEQSIFGSIKERKTNAGFLSIPIDEFDSKFFGISSRDATFMDPQSRLLHEVTWESLENAGIDPTSLRNSHTGIFTGSWMNDYKDIVQASTERDFFRTYMGNSIGTAAARLSLLLGATGPSIATESGCSSAIVAVDMAVKSLRSGESNLALAGGVNLLLHPFKSDFIDYVIAPDGRCKTFDEQANGFGRAEGCAVLVLKRLGEAVRDGDNIWAVIKGSAISQEGLTRSLGTPTVHCEALAMKLALKDAGVMPEQVSFVETHGTGTSVGDPMEVAAVAEAYNSKFRQEPLIIGSVKTNIGHTESCSGLAGIIKTVLAMQHELIPKHLNLTTVNPEVNLSSVPATIPIQPIPWPKTKNSPRIAGVSSFGITGTDGHVIIEEAATLQPPLFQVEMERPLHLIKFSAKTDEALNKLLESYKNKFRETDLSETFMDYAYTANVGRASFSSRAYLIANNYQQAADAIETNKVVRNTDNQKQAGKICFLFTGQGSQYVGMAQALYSTSPVFRLNFDQCEQILKATQNISLANILWPSGQNSAELDHTMYSQTSIFCIEYCLFRLWETWGIKPDYVLGHSLGEFCAAVAAGLLSLENALKLVSERSRLIGTLPTGSMLVIKASVQQVNKLIEEFNLEVDIAAVNSQEQTVVAGDTEQISEMLSLCKEHGLKGTILNATHAFHSRLMEPVLEEYREVSASICCQTSSKTTYISGLDGTMLQTSEGNMLTPDYWVRHTRESVSFMKACKTLSQLGCQHFIEIGPHPVLCTFVMQNAETSLVSCYPSLRRNKDDWETILTSVGNLYLNGFTINWKDFDKPYLRKKVPTSLPFYPFQRKSFWVDCSQTSFASVHPLIGFPVTNASSSSIFENNLHLKSVPWLRDHCVGNRTLFPASAFAEMCMAAGYFVAHSTIDLMKMPQQAMFIENLRIEAPLELVEDEHCSVQVLVELKDDSQYFNLSMFRKNLTDGAEKWVKHCSTRFYPVTSTKEILEKYNAEKIRHIHENTERLTTSAFYKRAEATGLKFGETFRSIQSYTVNLKETKRDEVVSEINIPIDNENFILHPILVDAMIQSFILSIARITSEQLMLPVEIGKLVWLGKVCNKSRKIYLHTFWDEDGTGNVFALNEDYTPVAFMSNVQMVDSNVKTIESILKQQQQDLPDSWEEVWKPILGPLDNRAKLAPLMPVLTDEVFKQKLALIDKDARHDWEAFKNINRLVCLYSLRALLKLGWHPVVGETVKVSNFCDTLGIVSVSHLLIHFYFKMFQEECKIIQFIEKYNVWQIQNLPPSLTAIDHELTQLSEGLAGSSLYAPILKTYNHIGALLPDILTAKESILPHLFPTESEPSKQELSAEAYYTNHPDRYQYVEKAHAQSEAVLNATKQLNADDPKAVLRILEIGAGTGKLTESVLKKVEKIWGGRYEYFFTDISVAFFTRAQKKFEGLSDRLKFALFNVEEDPMEQGIPYGYFDWVVGENVLHATRDLKVSVENVRRAMKPGGSVMITETISQDRGITFVFGLLEGYWRFTDTDLRPWHSCVDTSVWEKLLLSCGFNFTHVCKAMGTTAIISAEATDKVYGPKACNENAKQWIYFENARNISQNSLLMDLKKAAIGNLVTAAIKPNRNDSNDTDISSDAAKIVKVDANGSSDIETLLELPNLSGIIYACGYTGDSQNQDEISLTFLHIAKKLVTLTKPPKLYIVTRGAFQFGDLRVASNPNVATLVGMAKSLKNENMELTIRIVDLDGLSCSEMDAIQLGYEITCNKETKERERVQVAYRNGQRFECKFARARMPLNELQLPPCTNRYMLALPNTRIINDLKFDVMEPEDVTDCQVEVSVKAWSLNFRDVLTILKPSEEFEKLNAVGLDYAGVVTKIGKNIPSTDLQLGDRVCGVIVEEKQLPSHLVVEEKNLIKIPDNITFAEASTIPAVYLTAYYGLVTLGKLKREDSVLIHTGSGGVGLAAIAVAKQIGANIITTAGSTRKRAFLRSLGIKHVFKSRDTSYKTEILLATCQQGVDVVLNSITGPGFKEATLEACATNARFLEMSKLSVWTEAEVMERRKDIQYKLFDLTALQRSEIYELLEEIKTHMKHGVIQPIPYTQFDGLMVRQALQYLQKAKHIGKVVVRMPEVCTKNGQWTVETPLFYEEGTYIITGGLGGIGFEVCKWMLNKGASNIVLIGRNSPQKCMADEICRLNNSNPETCITVKLGDIGKYLDCQRIIDEIVRENGKRPIRGIHHCAGVLWDNLYPKQTWEAFQATFNPKVSGTWNLHNLTKSCPIDHFVFYSSLTSLLGTPGQANHSSANCFEDAFAHYRHQLGLPATSINWGQWSEVGCAKDVCFPSIVPVSVKRMLKGLEVTLRSQRVQSAFGEFVSLQVWTMTCPSFKYYLDEKLLKSLNEEVGQECVHLKTDQFWKEIDAALDKGEKMDVIIVYMKIILRNALRMDADEAINEDADMHELGVDSLMLIELKNSIQGLLGSRIAVTANMLKDCQTIRDLAIVIANKICGDYESVLTNKPLSPEDYANLLEADCKLDDSLVTATMCAVPVSEIRTILITGVTGQVGPYILSVLSQTQVTKMICLVRTREGQCPTNRLLGILEDFNLSNQVNMSKIECIRGDVAKSNFGLPEEDYAKLCNSTDAVFHLAAKSNHVEHYRKHDDSSKDVRSVNVGGTTNVVKFAMTSKIKRIFYSSGISSVFGEGEADTLCEDWPEADQRLVISTYAIGGYIASKYVSEMLLKEANARGVPCKVFRFPWIMGDSRTGQLKFLNNHYILRFLSYLKLKAMPDAPVPAIVLPVDVCADLSVKIFFDEKAPDEVYNIAHPKPELEVEFKQISYEEFGIEINVVDWRSSSVVEKLHSSDMPLESLRELYEDIDKGVEIASSDAFRAIQGYLRNPEGFFENRKLTHFVPGYDKQLSSTMETIRMALVYAKEKGAFNNFGIPLGLPLNVE